MPISAERCVELLADYLANRPQDPDDQAFDGWHADVLGVVRAYSRIDAVRLEGLLGQIINPIGGRGGPWTAGNQLGAAENFLAHVRALHVELRLQTNAFQTAQVPAGAVYDYFAEVRQLIATAENDLLFSDPYLDSTFVHRYLPLVAEGVTVRLLTSERSSAALGPACELFSRQYGRDIQVRWLADRVIHDRHLVVDGRDVFHSGASFKDGARNAATSINQIVDTARVLIRALEEQWEQAQPVG